MNNFLEPMKSNVLTSICRKRDSQYSLSTIFKYPPLSKIFAYVSIKREYQNRIYWNRISGGQKLSEEFIREFQNNVDWKCICAFQKLSEPFIREFQNKVSWNGISQFQTLSESFIREFQDSVDWMAISIFQKLSEDFIREFKDKVCWECISLYQKLSDDFIQEFKENLDMDSVKGSWHYKTTTEKKAAVEQTGLYECHEDYFIAYMGVKIDRHGFHNFQYQYIPGKTYETVADYSDQKCHYHLPVSIVFPFGFLVQPKEKAKINLWLSKLLVITCKIYYKDVTNVLYQGSEISCCRLTVLD